MRAHEAQLEILQSQQKLRRARTDKRIDMFVLEGKLINILKRQKAKREMVKTMGAKTVFRSCTR